MDNGVRLRAARVEAGVGLDTVARLSGRSKSHLSRVERGERDVTPAMVLAYERALGRPLNDIQVRPIPPPLAEEDVTEEEMRRRHFLSTIVTTATGIAATESLSTMMDAAPAMGDAANLHDLLELEAAALSLTSQDLSGGSTLAVVEGKALLNWALKGVLPQVRRAGAVRRLKSTAGYLADRVGWALFNLGRHDEATHMFGVGLRLAVDTDDGNLQAQLISDLSSHSIFRGRPADALGYIQVMTGRGVLPPLRSALFGVAAEAYGRLGDAKNAMRNIDAATETALRPVGSDEPPKWLPAFRGPSGLIYGTAQASMLLFEASKTRGNAANALQLQEEALSGMSGRSRSAAICSARAAILAFHLGDQERALSFVGRIPAQPAAVRSTRVQRELSKLNTLVETTRSSEAIGKVRSMVATR